MTCPNCNAKMHCTLELSFYEMNYTPNIGDGIVTFYECENCGAKMQLDVPKEKETDQKLTK